MWSRVKFILWTNPAIEGKSNLIYKAWHLSKMKEWQELNNLKRDTYWKDFSNTSLSVLDEAIWTIRDKRYKSELFEYESLVILWFIETCIFEFHDIDWYIKNRFYLNRSDILSEGYNEDMIDDWFLSNPWINYITVFYKFNQDITNNYLNQHVLFSKDDKTVVHVRAQLIMFTLQFSHILYDLNKLHKEYWLRRFVFDSSDYPENIDWFSCLLYLEITWLIEIETWSPKILSTDKINPINYIKIKKQDEFRRMVQWFMEEDLKDIEKKESLSENNATVEKIDETRPLITVWDDYIITWTNTKIKLNGVALKIMKSYFTRSSILMKLSKKTYSHPTQEAFEKALTRLRAKIKAGWITVEKVLWKKDEYILKKHGQK